MAVGLIVGFAGTRLDEAQRRMLVHPAVVGAILFSRNYESPRQLDALTEELRGLRNPRLLLCVDQEGGRVQRFRAGFTPLPALGVIGAWYARHPSRALDLAYRHGRVMAAELLGHGLDLSLAPVLDLDRGSRVIGDRSLGSDPAAVCELARYLIAGMRDAGMKCCGKHFPGHGSIAGDTHDERVTDPRTLDAIAADLRPFESLAAELDSVMPAHVIYPAVDDRPAGFSTAWLDGVLRRKLGFAGTVISDDLDMAGAGRGLDPTERLAAAEAAGCDLALVCDPDSAAALVSGLDPEAAAYTAAARAAAGLLGRPSFTLAEQELVPEFRGWKQSLERLARSSAPA